MPITKTKQIQDALICANKAVRAWALWEYNNPSTLHGGLHCELFKVLGYEEWFEKESAGAGKCQDLGFRAEMAKRWSQVIEILTVMLNEAEGE